MEQKTTKCQYPDWGYPIADSQEPKADLQKWGEAMSELKEALLEYHPFFILARRLLDILVRGVRRCKHRGGNKWNK